MLTMSSVPEVLTNGSQIGEDKETNNHVEHVKRLIKHRNELREETKLSGDLNQILRKVINKKLKEELATEQVGFSEHGDEEDTTRFNISVSTRHSKYSSLPICEGCNRNFRLIKNDITRRRVYTKHCIKDCDKYKQLGLVAHCFECKLSFVNQSSRSKHITQYHRSNRKQIKPKWMSFNCFIRSTNLKTFDTVAKCKGCQQKFKGHGVKSGIRIEFDYYVHCIEQCEGYKKLKLIRECKTCNLMFLDSRSLAHHAGWKHRDLNATKIRSWMNRTMLTRQHSEEFNAKVNCKGCGKSFKAYMNTLKRYPELDYYIHCVEECKDFEKLRRIQKCDKCNKIFLNKTNYRIHSRTCVF